MVVVFDPLSGEHYSLPRREREPEPADSVKREPGARPLDLPPQGRRPEEGAPVAAGTAAPEGRRRGLVVDLYL